MLREANAAAETFENIKEKVNKTTFKFICSQIKLQGVICKGRRFSEDDKLLALSIMKKSPKCYKLLRKIFALPSSRTIQRLLKNIPVNQGICPFLFNTLKGAVQSLKPIDRYCCLMFDEMSIDSGLSFCPSEDRIHGFVKNAKPTFTDHALVFMVRGINKKWKQPVAYFFKDATTKATELSCWIKKVIAALLNIGLEVVATVRYLFNIFFVSLINKRYL